MLYKVVLTKKAERDLQKIPLNIQLKLQMWADAVKEKGVETVRKSPGYHDEGLKGNRRVGDEFPQENFPVGIERVDNDVHELLDFGLELMDFLLSFHNAPNLYNLFR